MPLRLDKAPSASLRPERAETGSTERARPCAAKGDEAVDQIDTRLGVLGMASDPHATEPAEAPALLAQHTSIGPERSPRSLPEERVMALLETYDLQAEAQIQQHRSALETSKIKKRFALDAAIARVPHELRRLPLESFLVDYGGELPGSVPNLLLSGPAQPDAAEQALLPMSSSAEMPLPTSRRPNSSEAGEVGTSVIQVRSSGLERGHSPVKRPLKYPGTLFDRSRTPSSSPTRGTHSTAPRPARTGEHVLFSSVNGSPIEGNAVGLSDGRILTLRPHSPSPQMSPSGWQGSLRSVTERVAAARQAAFGSSSSIHLPSSPDPRKRGRAAAGGAAMSMRTGTSTRRTAAPSSGNGRGNTLSSSSQAASPIGPVSATTRMILLSSGQSPRLASTPPRDLGQRWAG